MDIHSPQSTLKFLHGIAGVPRLLEMDFDECKSCGSLIRSAKSILTDIIDCILLDWLDHVPNLLSKGIHFLRSAIEQEASIGTKDYDYEIGSAYRDLAMLRWLAEGIHDDDSFNLMVLHYSNHYATMASRNINSIELDLSLSDYLNGRAYDEAIALFERSSIKPPASPQLAKRPGAAAYIFALHRRDGLYDEVDVSIMLRKLFRKYVGPKWLAHGQEGETAIWMKIAYWSPGESAIDSLLKCREFVPSLRVDSDQ